MSEPICAATYYRMSDLRQDESIDRQKSQVIPYAEKHGYQIIREYVDEGITGSAILGRKEFQRMLRDAQAGQFQVILCDDKDRFGRFDNIDLGEIVAPLRRKGIWLESVALGRSDWESFSGRITDAVLQESKNMESDAISRRVLSSQLLKATEGRDTGSPPLYGYRTEADPVRGKCRVADGRKAEVVRLLFTLYDQGSTLGQLAEELYRRGVPSPKGNLRWSRSVIKRLLANRRYLGDWTWGVNASGKRHRYGKDGLRPTVRTDTRHAVNPPETWVVRPDHHEALVDRETFGRVQARLRGNQKKTTPIRGGGEFVLSRLLVCSHCGSFLVGITKKGQRIYLCRGYLAYGKDYCKRNAVSEQAILALLIRKLKEAFLDPAHLQQLRERAAALEAKSRSDDNRKRLQQQLTELDRKIDQGTENLTVLPPDRLPSVTEKIRQFERERDAVRSELKRTEVESPVDELEKRIAVAGAMLWRLQEALKEDKRPLLRDVLRESVSRVELRWSHQSAGKITRCRLDEGAIHLWPTEERSYLYPSGPRWC
jgi:DNA invertase Pin-like site-specific DNA recombinase